MASDGSEGAKHVARISMSIPEDLLVELDRVVADRGFPSRSQAISLMLNEYLLEHQRTHSEQVMVGTITLFYQNTAGDIQRQLADLQYRNINEVISSLHVQLIENQTLEVILVQGPPRQIEKIADEMIALKGVLYGKTQLIASLIPPLHPLPR